MAKQNPQGTFYSEDGFDERSRQNEIFRDHDRNEENGDRLLIGSGRRLLFEVFEDIIQSLINGGLQALADNVIQHLLEDAFLLFAFFLFLVAHLFTLLSMMMLSGSSSSASSLAARRFNKSCWMRRL